MAAKKKTSLIRRGIASALESTGRGSRFLTLQADQPVDVALMGELDDVLTVDTHSWWDYNPAPHLVCLGPGCPSCALGNESRANSYLAVCTPDGEVKYIIAKVSILNALKKYSEAVGNLVGRVVRLERTGAGLKTKYSVIPLGKKVDVSKFVIPDLEEQLGALTLEDQLVKMEDAGIDTSRVKKSLASKAVAAEVETEEEPAAGWTETSDDETDDDWGSV